MNTLTDRYVWAVVRLLPEPQRAEIDAELRSLVTDMIDARDSIAAESHSTESHSAESLERDVLTELGDPGRLAANYVHKPRALVGPQVFPEYVRALKVVAVVALPIVVVASVLAAMLADDSNPGSVIGAAVAGLFGAAIQVAFWVTLVYAFADRWKADNPWTTDALPNVSTGSPNGVNPTEVALSIVFTVLFGVAIVWQRFRSPLTDAAGDRIPFLHDDVWAGVGIALLGILVASVAVEVTVLVTRRWSPLRAAAKVSLNVALFALVAWLALDDRLLNTQFLETLAERAEWNDVPTINPWIPIAVVGVIEIWDSVERIRSARSEQRHRAVDVVGRSRQ